MSTLITIDAFRRPLAFVLVRSRKETILSSLTKEISMLPFYYGVNYGFKSSYKKSDQQFPSLTLLFITRFLASKSLTLLVAWYCSTQSRQTQKTENVSFTPQEYSEEEMKHLPIEVRQDLMTDLSEEEFDYCIKERNFISNTIYHLSKMAELKVMPKLSVTFSSQESYIFLAGAYHDSHIHNPFMASVDMKQINPLLSVSPYFLM